MAHRDTHYKRVLPNQLLSKRHDEESTPISTPNPRPMSLPTSNTDIPAYNLPQGMTPEDLSQAFETVAAADQAMPSLPPSYASRDVSRQHPGAPARQHSHVKEASNKTEHDGGGGGGGEDEAGGHDAPNWSRLKSASVLMICTALYALIAGAWRRGRGSWTTELIGTCSQRSSLTPLTSCWTVRAFQKNSSVSLYSLSCQIRPSSVSVALD